LCPDSVPEKHLTKNIEKYLWYITGKQNDTFKKQCVKAGMTINYFSKEEMAKSLEVNKPLIDQIRKMAGDELIDEYIAAVEKAPK
jgi:TRAP-type C4-dicarboxylate transport system substrate-binding protein